jgi:hypothetical protein
MQQQPAESGCLPDFVAYLAASPIATTPMGRAALTERVVEIFGARNVRCPSFADSAGHENFLEPRALPLTVRWSDRGRFFCCAESQDFPSAQALAHQAL